MARGATIARWDGKFHLKSMMCYPPCGALLRPEVAVDVGPSELPSFWQAIEGVTVLRNGNRFPVELGRHVQARRIGSSGSSGLGRRTQFVRKANKTRTPSRVC